MTIARLVSYCFDLRRAGWMQMEIENEIAVFEGLGKTPAEIETIIKAVLDQANRNDVQPDGRQ